MESSELLTRTPKDGFRFADSVNPSHIGGLVRGSGETREQRAALVITSL
jgi:hypothetical protein